MNIKKSLALQFSLIVAAILLVFSVLVYQNSSLFRHNEFEARLKEKGFAITELLLEEAQIDTVFLEDIEKNNLNILSQQRIFVYDKNKKLIYHHPVECPEPDKKYLSQVVAGKDVEFNEGQIEYAGFSIIHPKGKYYTILGAFDETGIKKIDFLRTLLIQVFFVSLIVTGFLGWFFAKRSLNPMIEVINEVDQITATNLHRRVKTGKSKDEIAHLAVTFNEMLDRLEASFTMQKNFVANASHEFRTPLTAMKGQIEVMLMQKRKEEDYIRTLSSLNEDINNVMELLQGLSELAKINTEFVEEAFEPVSVVDTMLDARSELLRNKPKYSIVFDIQNFTGEEGRNNIMGNTALIKSVFTNLMDNACKFSPDFRVKVSVVFNEHVLIHFRDEGIGISEEEIQHIFEPFYRGNDTRNISGHGIGLSLVKRIIDLHHGKVEVRSTQGIGTVFTITLPTLSSKVQGEKPV